MKFGLVGATLLAMLALSGCGGGGGSASGGGGISANVPNVAFTGITVNSPPVVTFTVKDTAGNPVTGLKSYDPSSVACGGSNVSFAIAKYVQNVGNATNDGYNWQSLISLQRSSNNPHNVIEGTTDPVHGATGSAGVGTLSYNATDKAYTYAFGTDVTAAAYTNSAANAAGTILTNGNVAVKDGTTLHRVAIQLCYVDPASGQTVKLNPYIDFTIAPPPANTVTIYKGAQVQVVDRASCNVCHQNFAAHANPADPVVGNFVDPQTCVMCHNPGSSDYATGNPIDFKLMVHKFHMGKRLTQAYAAGSSSANAMLYPQDQRNCSKCHTSSVTGANVAVQTINGDNWQSKASKNACFACHDDYKAAGSKWQTVHKAAPGVSVTDPDSNPDSLCATCHGAAWPKASIPAAHAIAELGLSVNYQLNIQGITRNANNTLTVVYSVSNPATSSNYDILSPQYSYTTGATTTKTFAGLNLLFAWGDYSNGGQPRGQPLSIPALSGTKVDSSNRYTLTSSTLPATGTVTVAFVGNVTPPDSTGASLTVPVANAIQSYAMSGAVQARRQVVSTAKCNACHGQNVGYTDILTATPSLSGHFGSTDPQTCTICHNGNLDATALNLGAHNADSGDFKRMIHSMHKTQGANYPVMPSTLITAANSTSKAMPGAMAGTYTGIMNCTACHEGNSYLTSASVLGSSTTVNTVNASDPTQNLIISPKAAACSSCHTDAAGTAMRDHMIQTGGAAFATVTQAQVGTVLEQCDGCHLPGAVMPVDKAHGVSN